METATLLADKRIKAIISKLGNDKRVLGKNPYFLLSKPKQNPKTDLDAEDLLDLFRAGILNESETMFWLGVVAIQNEEKAKRHESLSTIDELTQIYNRRVFIETLSRELERLRRKAIEVARQINSAPSLAMFLIDIDHFKKVNDTYGHLVGDQVLQRLAEIIKKNIRTSDTVFRYGGEEFAVLLPDTDEETALEIAERLRRKTENFRFPLPEKGIAGRIKKQFRPKRVTISIGVTVLEGKQILKKPVTDTLIPYLIRQADKALYNAKNNGRNRVEKGGGK